MVSAALLLGDGVVDSVANLVILSVTFVLVRCLALLLVHGLAGVLVLGVVLSLVLPFALLLSDGGVLGVVLGVANLIRMFCYKHQLLQCANDDSLNEHYMDLNESDVV